MDEGKCTREQAIKALRKHNGDPVEVLLDVEFPYDQENNNKKKDDNNIEKYHEEAIQCVMEEGKCSREATIKALEKYDWDPVQVLINVH